MVHRYQKSFLALKEKENTEKKCNFSSKNHLQRKQIGGKN
jgi:hypothetical protein